MEPRDIQGSEARGNGPVLRLTLAVDSVGCQGFQCGLETLSLLLTMGELGTWVFFSPPTPPNHSASIHAAWKQGRNQEHSLLSAVLHDG